MLVVPWMFGMPDNNSKYNAAWKHILDTNQLRGSNGLRTVEPSYQYYMRQYRYEGSSRECQWNVCLPVPILSHDSEPKC